MTTGPTTTAPICAPTQRGIEVATSADIKDGAATLDAVAGTDFGAKIDALQQYAAAIPDDTQKQIEGEIDKVAGDTGVGAGVKAGLVGAGAGLASGAAVGASVAAAGVAVGVLTAGAVAAQTVPVVGTIVGAILGLVAGLVAFFTGKSKAEKDREAKLEAEWQATLQRVREAIALIPDGPLRDRVIARINSSIQAVGWSTPAETAARYVAVVEGIPAMLKEETVKWVAEQAAAERAGASTSILTPRRIGYAIVGAAFLGGLYIAHQRKMI